MSSASRYDELARSALAEVASPAHVGDWIEDRVREDAAGVVDVVYSSAQAGYRGWSWVVSIAEQDDEAPSVLELGLIPGDDALLAPEWIPWSVRLAEWKAQQEAAAAEAAESVDEAQTDDPDGEDDALDEDDEPDEEDDDLDEEDDDLDDLDEDDLDDDGPRLTHGGDIDGVDIDDLDEA
ncbi:MAG: hypothetical protein BGO95_10000 [Micrococcales bacterium 73-13]|nr:MAG: hypothetical protein BGO95_10000 [Micrococcales bacterium 73-13]